MFITLTSCCVARFPAIVADAGSTGTRVYAFYLTEEGVDISLLGKITPGLSTFAEKDEIPKVAEQLAPLIDRGARRLGVDGIRVHILGTGGVRSLSASKQVELWAHLRVELQEHLHDNPSIDSLVLEAIQGTREAFYGLVSVRHLTGGNYGVLDLGGSSAEVAHAGMDDTAGSEDDILVTHAQLGTEKIRSDVSETCAFAEGDLEAGSRCSQGVREVLKNHHIDRILFDKDHDFYGVSAFAYSLDFAHWLLEKEPTKAEEDVRYATFLAEYPRPSLKVIRGLCGALCAEYLDIEKFTQHPRTNAKEAEGRCFDVCYVAELLAAFGVKEHERRITFAISVEDREIEWTLGYYLTHLVSSTQTLSTEVRDDL